ncbi:hypothetical protein K4F52_002922 [Lecanicillium sp. MT-2017a]|nr:hypothetical protein K4F52_002922 [Lecanicillium sp. MT-2017a]
MASIVERRQMEREDEFRNLKTVAVEQLAKLLYIKPALTSERDCKNWLYGQARQINTLDRKLVRTTLRSAAQGLINFSQIFDPKQPKGLLCPVHSELNGDIVDTLMRLVVREGTYQTDRYRHRRQKEYLSPLVGNWLTRMDEISALWIGQEKWEQRMRRQLHLDIHWNATSPCIACKLSVVGGSARFLTDLRASVLARKRYSREIHGSDSCTPCLSRMLDAWVAMCYPKEQRSAIAEESEMLANIVFSLRDQLRQAREYFEQVTGRIYYPPRPSDMTESGLPMPRAVTQEEYERECARRGEGEFYGERDSGWDWSLTGTGTTTGTGSGTRSCKAPELDVPANPAEHRWPFLDSSQTSPTPSQMNADSCDSGPRPQRAGQVQQSQPRRHPTLREQLQSSRQRVVRRPVPQTAGVENEVDIDSRVKAFRSWAATVAVHHPELGIDVGKDVAQTQTSVQEAPRFVRDGDTRSYGQREHYTAPEPSSAVVVEPDSPFTVSPVSPQGQLPPVATAPSSRYSANPGPPPSTARSVPMALQRTRSDATRRDLQRGARNRDRTPPRGRPSNGSDEAVLGDTELEYFQMPQRLGSRRLHRQYREQIQPTRPVQQHVWETMGDGRRPSLEAADTGTGTASCYTAMGWGGRGT